MAVSLSRGVLVGLLLTGLAHVTAPSAWASQPLVVTDPEVSALVAAGWARVLVELRIEETNDPARRVESIGRAQEAVLSRLPRTHAHLTRRYTSIPTLGLEIDATALRALQTMTDLVVAIKRDALARPQ